ncbi:MAG: hypothetical protein LBB94_05530 [Clostridiales bacterium]|nr:hypothetical protein [Clostridiales bacterium]
MKSQEIINLNEVFAGVAIFAELSAVIFGAELALKYANASDSQLKEVRDNIARSAFASFRLDYDAMLAAAQPNRVVSPPSMSPIEAESTPFYSETSGAHNAAVLPETDSEYSEPDFAYYPNALAQPSEYDNSLTETTPDDFAARSYQAPAGGFNMDINDGFEQTVVYENYPNSSKNTDSDAELSAGYGSYPESAWDPEGKQDKNADSGKIHWTTYSSATNPDEESSKTMSNPFNEYPKTEDSSITV